MSFIQEKARPLDAASMQTPEGTVPDLPSTETEQWFDSFVALPPWLGADLGSQLEAWVFAPPTPAPEATARSTAGAQGSLARGEAGGSALEATRVSREGLHSEFDDSGVDAGPDAIESEQHGSAAARPDADRAPSAERTSPQSPFLFWSEVVSMQRELEQRAQLDPKLALDTALVWAVVAHVQGAQRAHTPGAPLVKGEHKGLDAKGFVERLHADLEARATSALVSAWQLRASALCAAEGGKG